jgi:putative phage-type endonuclease
MIIQGTPEWFAAKRGNVGASHISDIMATTKSGYSASRKNYAAQLIVERLTGETAESYTNAAMQWGIDTEPLARQAYEERMFVEVVQVGWVQVQGMRAGCSPDGLVGDDGLIEIKCPNTATHIDTLLTGKIDRKYILQMQWQMFTTGRVWCDYVSYDPRLPDNLSYYRQRVMRDDAMIDEIVAEVNKFLAELDEMEKKLREVVGCISR